jgi:curli biogenesis system outer membrane secretion channel CsgG
MTQRAAVTEQQSRSSNHGAAIKEQQSRSSNQGAAMKLRGVVFLALLFANALAHGQQSVAKHRVAVLDFNYANVQAMTQAAFGSNQNVGSGFADLLADRLTNDGMFRVIDRNAINRVLSQPIPAHEPRQDYRSLPTGGLADFGNAPPPTNGAATKVGQVLGVDPVIQFFGVDSIITGEITQFGPTDMQKKNLIVDEMRKLFRTNDPQRSKAVFGVTAHMVDVHTGEILVSVNVKSESLHASNNILRATPTSVPITNMKNGNFPKTAMGEAVLLVVNQLALAFEQKSSKVTEVAPVPITGLVADISGTDVTTNVGFVDGVNLGDTLLITRKNREIKDPANGNLIRAVEDTIGQITITRVELSYSVGHFTGTGKPAINDTVKNTPGLN